MANPREIWTVPIGERNTSQWIGTLVQEDGVTPLALGSISTITLTITLIDGTTIVNSVDGTNILNVGRGTMHATSGLLTIKFDRADNQMVDTTASQEKHLWIIEVTYGPGGVDGLTREVEVTIKNLASTP